MPNPLAPTVHRHADQKLHLGHFEGCGVPVPHQIADQRAIVRNRPRAGRVADPCRLDHRVVVAHHVGQADEAVVKDLELTPTQLIYRRSHGAAHHRKSLRGSCA